MAPSFFSGTILGLAGHVASQALSGTPAAASSCAARFSWETTQLTDAAIASTGASGKDLFAFGTDSPVTALKPPAACKLFPGDSLWPAKPIWNLFNATLGGALIQTVPLAAPCYSNWPGVTNPAMCQYVTDHWSDPHLHVEDPTSAMFPLFQGRTCLPPSLGFPHNDTCTLGGYAAYSVAVIKVSQIQLALNFARNANIRLVVKNTGHDFADKSIGAGSLSVWTHKLKDIKFYSDYRCRSYKGPAFKLGAGVVTEEVYQAAEQNGVTVVGGECRTVGLAGGYVAGGGHSPMATLVGMGADQVLSLEVVLPSGKFITASKDTYPDLYWALRGGGGSTYGVVTSVTIKAYPKIPVTTMTFGFATSPTLSADTFWSGMRAYMTYFDAFTAAGAYGYFLVGAFAPGNFFFQFMPFWGGNMTSSQLTTLVTPFLNDLQALGIPVTPNITQYDSLYKAFNGTFPPEAVGSPSGHAASRLFPRENFISPSKLNATVAAVRYVIEQGGFLVGYNIRPKPNPGQDNAVNPAWRNSTGFFILAGAAVPDNGTDAQIAAASEVLTNDWMARWRAVSPGGGSYMAEGDINEPNFQTSFYGAENYPKLYALKQKYDPTGLFYAPTAVGSEDWYITGQIPYFPTQNGRLCRRT
ncbi:hypothetical protein B0H66DRAFT_535705 [Apodospora peruviana]|uniref:FAD-binding PCMH-type domain-containing protein n=1 Tax=Apodospora peruviana TaxID=516989 RepID=A0AAE0HXN1_9PEZI|nr:hypothetical protein B0H66DRAFT_535705 [Apodospora peruviana]